MAITRPNTNPVVTTSTSNTNPYEGLTIPATVASGDIIAVYAILRSVNATCPVSKVSYFLDGKVFRGGFWSRATNSTGGGCYIAYRIADGTEAGEVITIDWLSTAQAWGIFICDVLRGVSNTSPLDVDPNVVAVSYSGGGSKSGPTITTLTDGAYKTIIAGVNLASTTEYSNWDSGSATEIGEWSNGGNTTTRCSGGLAYETVSTAGSSTTNVTVVSQSVTGNIQAFAWRPDTATDDIPQIVNHAQGGTTTYVASYAAPLPANLTTGNVLVMFAYISEYSGTEINGPANWTDTGIHYNSAYAGLTVFTRVVDGTEGATATITMIDATPVKTYVVEVSNVDTSSIIDAHNGLTQATGASLVIPTFSTNAVKERLLLFAANSYGTGVLPITLNPVETNINSGAASSMIGILATAIKAASGAVGTETITWAANPNASGGIHIALKTASGGPSAQNINAAFISSSSQLYGVKYNKRIDAAYITSSAIVRGPAKINVTVKSAYIASGSQLYGASKINRTLKSAYIASQSTMYGSTPHPTKSLSANFIASASTLYGPTVHASVILHGPFISSQSVVYPISKIFLSFRGAFISSQANLYGGTLQKLREPQFISTAFLTSQSQLFGPTLNSLYKLAAGYVASQSALYGYASRSLVYRLNANYIPSSAQLYPIIHANLTIPAARINAATLLYGPQFATVRRLDTGFIASQFIAYGPRIDRTVLAAFIPSALTLYGGTFRPVQYLSAAFIPSSIQVYGVSLHSHYLLQSAFINSQSTTFAPVVKSLYTVHSAFIPSSSQLYGESKIRLTFKGAFISPQTNIYGGNFITIGAAQFLNAAFLSALSQLYGSISHPSVHFTGKFIPSTTILRGAQFHVYLHAAFVNSQSHLYGSRINRTLNAGYISPPSEQDRLFGANLSSHAYISAAMIQSVTELYGVTFDVSMLAAFLLNNTQLFPGTIYITADQTRFAAFLDSSLQIFGGILIDTTPRIILAGIDRAEISLEAKVSRILPELEGFHKPEIFVPVKDER